jgi:hypothetical protein
MEQMGRQIKASLVDLVEQTTLLHLEAVELVAQGVVEWD